MSKQAPARSIERQRLAAAIERHRNAVVQQQRVTEALSRLDAKYWDVLEPAVAAANEALMEAKARAPDALVSAALGEQQPDDSPSVEQAEAAFADIKRKVVEVKQARKILGEEAARAQSSVAFAQRDLDAAVKAAVEADAQVRASLTEFYRAARRMLRCAKSIRTAGLFVEGADAHGLAFVITEAAAPMGQRAFRDDPAWGAALAALRENADTVLPGLPPEDLDDVGARNRAAA